MLSFFALKIEHDEKWMFYVIVKMNSLFRLVAFFILWCPKEAKMHHFTA